MERAVTLERDSSTNRYGMFIDNDALPCVLVYAEQKSSGEYRIIMASFSEGQIRNPTGIGESNATELSDKLLKCARFQANNLVNLLPIPEEMKKKGCKSTVLVDKTLPPKP